MKLIINFLLVSILFFTIEIHGVIGQEWMKYINTTDNYKTVINNIDQHFENKGKGRGSGYKQYMRWRYKMDAATNASENIKNISALQKKEYDSFMRSLPKSTNRGTNGDWESLGPYSASGNSGVGRINCMAFHPTNPNIIWAGSPNGGLWKTINGGSTWTIISNYFVSLGISGIAIDYTNPDIIYILTGDGDGGDSFSIGVMKTIDGGINWQKTGLTFGITSLVKGFFIKIHPTNPQILRVGTTQGLYSNTNGGTGSWGQSFSSNTIWDFEYKPNDSNIFYLATNGGIVRLNNGVVFTYSGGPGSYERIALTVTPAAPENVYALFGGDLTDPGVFSGFYLSNNGGASYTLKSLTPNILGWDNGGDAGTQADYDLCLAVHESDPNRIYVGGINSWTSENGGVNWSRMSHWNGSGSPYVHADFHNLYYLNGTLFACNDGGVYKTTNNGANWTEFSSGINTMQFYYIDFHDNSWMGGTQDNGTHKSTLGNLQSNQIGGGDGFGCQWHNTDHSIQFTSSQNRITRKQPGIAVDYQIYEVSDGFWYSELSMSKNNNGHLWVNRGESLFRGNQNVFPWDWSWPSTGSETSLTDGIRGYEQGVNNPNVMYVVSGSEIIKSTNVNTLPSTWTVLTHPSPGTALQNVTVDPANANRVWVVCSGFTVGNKVFKSENGGDVWTNISGSLPNVQIRSIVYDSPGSDKIYIGTDLGVFYRNSTMSDWQYFSNNLPPAHVTSLKIFGGFIYAGTYGRGIWRSPIFSSCPENLTLTQANDPGTIYNHGKQIHHASNSITNSRIISGTFGTDAIYTSGNFIDFTDGFQGLTGTFIEAKIGGCPE
jgi:photosystem II stability/assembly factor-like uncharacterized protein